MEILAKALDHERITLDSFLKVPITFSQANGCLQETRKLAREQFLVKALIQKILKATGIVPGNVKGESTGIGAGMGGLTGAEYYYS